MWIISEIVIHFLCRFFLWPPRLCLRVSRCTLATLLSVWRMHITRDKNRSDFNFLRFRDDCFICFLKANLSGRVDHRIINIWSDMGLSCPTCCMKHYKKGRVNSQFMFLIKLAFKFTEKNITCVILSKNICLSSWLQRSFVTIRAAIDLKPLNYEMVRKKTFCILLTHHNTYHVLRAHLRYLLVNTQLMSLIVDVVGRCDTVSCMHDPNADWCDSWSRRPRDI